MAKNMTKFTMLSLMALTITASSICSEEASDEQIGNELIEAATVGDTARVNKLLSLFPHLIHYHSNFTTPLHRAALSGHKPVVEILLRHGAPVDAPTQLGETALMFALVRHPEIIETLLRHGANIEHKDKYGETALSRAAARGFLESCLVLLQHGADTETKDREDHTPLHLATDRMHFHIVKALLENGADVDAIDSQGNTPLAHCSMKQVSSWTHEHTRRILFQMIGLLVHYGAIITNNIAKNIRQKFPGCEPQMETALAIEKKRRAFVQHALLPVDVANLIFNFEECYENHNCCGCSKTIRELPTPELVRVCAESPVHRVCIECHQEMREQHDQNCPGCSNTPPAIRHY